MFRSSIHQAVRAIKPSARGELEITDAIQWLIDEGLDVNSFMVTGYWKDTGKLDDMLECNRAVLSGLTSSYSPTSVVNSEIQGVFVQDESASIENSQIIGPVIIGPKVRVKNSVLGPNVSLAEGCAIEDTTVRDSIVLSGTQIFGVRGIASSLIGKEVHVQGANIEEGDVHLMLGDHSQVRLGAVKK
jgi:glucose-1-phosphate thymidylyltransferase